MRILPVIDLMHGQVVRGVAGRRDEYRPIVSTLTSSTNPVDVAQALRGHFGFDELYLADLDAIAGGPPALPLYDALHAAGFRIWVDAGLRNEENVIPLIDHGVDSIVAGLETLAGPDTLEALLKRCRPERLVFSLDLKEGRPLAATDAWTNPPRRGASLRAPRIEAIADHAIALGLRRILVLDLAQVGVGAGLGTEALCAGLRQEHAHLEIAAGGGVRGVDDVQLMCRAGVDWLLVASALHDGRLTPAACGLANQPLSGA